MAEKKPGPTAADDSHRYPAALNSGADRTSVFRAGANGLEFALLGAPLRAVIG
jgi:hypothetical protein